MPFMRGDPEMYDEILNEVDPADLPEGALGDRPSGEYEYETAEATFDPKKLRGISKAALDALLAMNATGFKVLYDGGYDEGFSHADSVFFAGGAGQPVDVVIDKFATPDFATAVRTAAKSQSVYGNAGEFYAKLADRDVAKHALDELAHELASKLLGDGYGTGEYSLYGAFTADLKTGEIIDDPDATKPTNMDL